ncbi:UrvD/REP family ATP-dependent DNA helicase [Pseudoclavibacter sp. AY1F1]|uniref:UrvD/REP family ATP-dependent DNA helicase n=1 Tax=Pseudoclavibacter sp. AY1F1 TaxID=2080583 RepID=UPI0015E4461F|nr:UrvD/REP family ATP-dependent DNA helicase [Pseudoclavibacter sp. AY1F1]
MTSGPAHEAAFLDATQRFVLDADTEAHLSVVGAPGSGKTTTLVELLAERVLVGGLATTEVLALTPDRRSAARLREVIGERLAVSTPGAMARTPESVAFEIVRADRARQGLQAPQLFTGADEDTILAELIQSDLEARAATEPAQLNAAPIEWVPPVTLEAIGLRGFRAEIRDLLAAMSEYDVTPERLEELAHLRPVWSGAAALARQFRESVSQAKPNAFDTPGIVLEAVSIVHSATRLDSFSDLKLLLVDDVHEFTESGRRLLVAFALRGVRVVSFGDPDITTGGFRGSRPELAADWRGETRGALQEPRRLVLGTVHRGSAELRAFVRGVTEGIGVQRESRHRLAEAVHAASPPASVPPAVARFSAPSSAAECRGIADYLRELHLLHDVPWDQMAVITRRGGSIESLRRQLAKLEVPTSSSQALPAARDKAVQAVVKLAAIASGAEELTPEAIAELAGSPVFAIDPVQLRRVRRALRLDEIAAGGNRPADELLVEAVSRVAGLRLLTDPDAPASATFERLLATGGSATGRSATRALQQLGSLLRAVAGEIEAAGGQQRSIAADEVLYSVWERLGLAKTWREAALGSGPRAEQIGAHLDALVTLFDVGKRFVERQPDASIDDFLLQWSGSEVTADSLAGRTDGGTVTVTTPAAVLGRQFRVVVVAGLSDGVWPNLRLRDSLLGAGQLAELERGIDTTRDLVDRRLEVLYDERRMFAQAVSRSSEWLLLTAEESEDSAPSPFFLLSSRTWDDAAAENAESALGALTLRGLVGELRRAAIVRGIDPSEAAGLARLVEEGVPGADPAQWYGLGGPTTGRPLHDPSDPNTSIPVSPSNIESFEDCGVNWFVSAHGGGSTSESMNVGNIVHAAAEFDFPDLEARTAFAQARLRSSDFDAPWQETAARAKVDELVRNLSAYLHRVNLGGGALLGAERSFTVEVRVEGEESAKITLRGKIDRIESTAAGSIDVVDFKTGKSMPSSDSMSTNAQLAAYQLALSTGAVSDPVERPAQAVALPPRSDRGETIPAAQVHEAKLVFLAKPTTKQEWSERTQQPFDEAETSEFFDRVRSVALGMIGIPASHDRRSPADAVASAHYEAHLESHCLGSFGGGRACALHAASEVTE